MKLKEIFMARKEKEVVVEEIVEPEYPKGTVIVHLDKDPNDPRRPRTEEVVVGE